MAIIKSTPVVKDVRLTEHSNSYEIVIDFDNDRHHALMIEKGISKKELVRKIRNFAIILNCDHHLDRKTKFE